MKAADTRLSRLFDQILDDRNSPKTNATVQTSIKSAAELEWLNAHIWKYSAGASGISQLETRTWLELAGIDSGPYKALTDPNLEAHFSKLPNFIHAYPSFFQYPLH